MIEPLGYIYSDGGRAATGRVGDAGDCVTRAIAVATGRAYGHVYDVLAARMKERGAPRSARNGVPRKVYERYLLELGWRWVPKMQAGSGCVVHVRRGEIPDEGRFVLRLSGHLCAVIDGVIYDTHDPSRDGTRCVYGWFERRET